MKKLIYNKIIPFKGFIAINLFGFIFVRKEKQAQIENNYFMKSVLLNHELVHTAQYKELLYVFTFRCIFLTMLSICLFILTSAKLIRMYALNVRLINMSIVIII